MSYILDALKRAEAERERGAVPGLHTHHATLAPVQTDHGTRRRAWLLAGAGAALTLGGIAAGLWLWQMPARPAHSAAVAPAVANQPAPLAETVPASAPTPGSASPPSAPLSAAVAPHASLPPAVSKPVAKPTPAASVAGRQALARNDPAAKAVEPGAAPAAPKPKASAAQASATSRAASMAATTPAAIPLLGNLPEDLRHQIPPLTITGSVYSENRAQRMLLVNNQVLSEGSMAAPDVSLEEIRARSSVFSFRGTRFRVAH